MEWFLLFFLLLSSLLGLINLVVLLFVGRFLIQMGDALKESNEATAEALHQNRMIIRKASGLMDVEDDR
jgi:hypothetical protein